MTGLRQVKKRKERGEKKSLVRVDNTVSRQFEFNYSTERKNIQIVENIKGSCQSSQELTLNKFHLKDTMRCAQGNCKFKDRKRQREKNYI